MGFLDQFRRWFKPEQSPITEELSLDLDEDPFEEPVVMEIRDVIDLHSIPPREVRVVVEEYLREARIRRFQYVRIIHGKGIGVQREIVRNILARTPYILNYRDAPAEAGGLGATIAELAIAESVE